MADFKFKFNESLQGKSGKFYTVTKGMILHGLPDDEFPEFHAENVTEDFKEAAKEVKSAPKGKKTKKVATKEAETAEEDIKGEKR